MDIREEIRRFVTSGRDTLYKAIWTAIGASLLLSAGSIWAFVSDALASKWAYALVGAGAAFLVSAGILVGVLILLTGRWRVIQRSQREKYISGEKGLLDLQLNFDTAVPELSDTLSRLNRENLSLARRIDGYSKKLPRVLEVRSRKKLLDSAAGQIDKTAERIEILSSTLEESSSVLMESCAGLARAKMANPGVMGGLASWRNGVESMLRGVRPALNSTRSYRESVNAVRGQTQTLNASADRLQAALDLVIGTLSQIDNTSSALIAEIDRAST